MRTRHGLASLAVAVLLAGSAWGGDIPRSARLVKDAGNQFLAAKKYADAVDAYLQALQLSPRFAEAHYNLGVSFLKGYQANGLALHHFSEYLKLTPDASDRESVEALVAALRARLDPVKPERGRVIGVVAGRLLVGGGDWARVGDRLEVAAQGQAPCAVLLADYIYPDCVLTQRVWDERALEAVKPGFVAVAAAGGQPAQ